MQGGRERNAAAVVQAGEVNTGARTPSQEHLQEQERRRRERRREFGDFIFAGAYLEDHQVIQRPGIPVTYFVKVLQQYH